MKKGLNANDQVLAGKMFADGLSAAQIGKQLNIDADIVAKFSPEALDDADKRIAASNAAEKKAKKSKSD